MNRGTTAFGGACKEQMPRQGRWFICSTVLKAASRQRRDSCLPEEIGTSTDLAILQINEVAEMLPYWELIQFDFGLI